MVAGWINNDGILWISRTFHFVPVIKYFHVRLLRQAANSTVLSQSSTKYRGQGLVQSGGVRNQSRRYRVQLSVPIRLCGEYKLGKFVPNGFGGFNKERIGISIGIGGCTVISVCVCFIGEW